MPVLEVPVRLNPNHHIVHDFLLALVPTLVLVPTLDLVLVPTLVLVLYSVDDDHYYYYYENVLQIHG